MNQQLEALTEVCYSKLAQFVQEERFDEASNLMGIIERLRWNNPLIGKLPSTYVKPKSGGFVSNNNETLYNILGNYKTAEVSLNQSNPYLENNYNQQSKLLQQPQQPQQPLTYEWADGYKDPREDNDYWRK